MSHGTLDMLVNVTVDDADAGDIIVNTIAAVVGNGVDPKLSDYQATTSA